MEIVETKMQGSPTLHGDVLDAILSRVPLLDLVYASRVSKSWEYSVTSSLLHLTKIKPWLQGRSQDVYKGGALLYLGGNFRGGQHSNITVFWPILAFFIGKIEQIRKNYGGRSPFWPCCSPASAWLFIHTQCRKNLERKTTFAYDPRSDIWIKVNQSQPITSDHLSITLQSSNSDFLCQLSPNKLSISLDPIHLTWTHVPPPRAWRTDPVVARVGSHVIVAGGCSWFEDDPMSVEMYDMDTSHWSTCQSLPDMFKHSAAATWLSVASNQEFMYLVEKGTGVLYSFSPATNKWAGPYDLKSDPGVFFSAVGFAGDDLMLAGIIGSSHGIDTLKIWKIKTETTELDEIGEIPEELMEKLKGEDPDLTSISLMAGKDLIYICKSSNPEEVIILECVNGNNWKWRSVKNAVLNDERKMGERMVMSCGSVGIADLNHAITFGDLKLF